MEEVVMKITEAKKWLDQGNTLELDVPASISYVAANYHVWRDCRRSYLCSVHYYDVECQRRRPQWMARRFEDFITLLPGSARLSEDWEVM